MFQRVFNPNNPDNPGNVTWDKTAECAFRPGLVVVYGELPDDIGSMGIEGLAYEEDQPHEDIGVYLYEVKDPIAASVSLRDQGYWASPMYLLFPSPMRMYFPGTLPAPSSYANDDLVSGDDGSASAFKVLVVDTGGLDGTSDSFRSGENGDPLPAKPIGPPYTFGHGSFIGDIIWRLSGATPEQVRIQKDTKSGNWDESLFHQALMSVSGTLGDYAVVNLSLGTHACLSSGAYLDPVLSAVALAKEFEAHQIVVAAAGNSGDNRFTFPASLGSHIPEVPLDPPKDIALQLPTILAVGAAPDTVHGAEYSTTGTFTTEDDESGETVERNWVTHIRQGCHNASFPDRFEISYPTTPGSEDTVTLELTDVVYWCGTSFAAPVVSAELICAIAGLDDVSRLSGRDVLSQLVTESVPMDLEGGLGACDRQSTLLNPPDASPSTPTPAEESSSDVSSDS